MAQINLLQTQGQDKKKKMVPLPSGAGRPKMSLGFKFKISDFYDEQVDIAVAGLSSVIEPVIIIFFGPGHRFNSLCDILTYS